VSYIFVECDLLDKNIPWTLVSPNDYANYSSNDEVDCESRKRLPLINGCFFEKIIKI